MIRSTEGARMRLNLARRRMGISALSLSAITDIPEAVVMRALAGGRVAAGVLADIHWALGVPLAAPAGTSPVPRIPFGGASR